MNKFKILVEVEVDGDPQKLMESFAGQLTEFDAFFADWGYEAWGGYEGPFMVSCKVTDVDTGKVIAYNENRDKPIDDYSDMVP